MNPGVGRVAPDDRQLGFLAQNGIREIRHLAETDADPWQILLSSSKQALDLFGIGRTVVVAGHPHAEPGRVGPVAWRAQIGAVGGRAHGQHP